MTTNEIDGEDKRELATIDMGEAFDLADRMLQARARTMLRSLSPEDREDAEQDVRVLLLTRIIPAYAGRGPLAHYLNKAILNALRDQRDKVTKRRKTVELPDDEVLARTTTDNPDVQTFVEEVLADPQRHMSKGMARLLRALMATPSAGAAATLLQMKPESVHQMTSRLRKQLRVAFNS
jgi:DNA-directed RNA polymerase specialized sigma24 family protein